MRLRRGLLIAGAALVVWSAAAPSAARSDLEVESSVYGGQSSGGWICGPSGTVRYGGAALGARVSERSRGSPEGSGLHGAVVVAAEGQVNDPATGAARGTTNAGRLPPDRVLGAARTRAGYGGRHARIDAGIGAFQGWSSASSREPIVVPYPELELAAGLLHRWAIVAGFGSPLVTTLHRPGAYLGADVRLAPVEVTVRGGAYRRGPATLGTIGSRFDLAAAFHVPGFGERLRLRVGFATGAEGDAGRLDGEASLGALVSY
jgi:hypothetical protein